ncbi:YesL family protein [Turicibacter sp. TJ11]|uniref:YesL family protein n=1 Tax=Turicibacter sp. TJ11 TaxID=2806443 RepID=UPI001F1A04F6|nr:YesL family protein [Turicibacter sp. TJ11]
MRKQDDENIFLKMIYTLSDMGVISILWMIGCLPIITIGASTTALFYVADKKVSGKESKILFDFIKSYKQNFVQSLLVTVILGVLWFSATIYLMMGYSFLQQGFSLSLFILVVIVFEVMMLSFYMCALLAKYELKTIMLIKNSFLFTHAYLLESIKAFGVIIAMLFCLVMIPGLLIILPAAIALTASHYIRQSILKFLDRKDVLNELEEV